MDIQMPEMDGISATRYIRQLKDSKKAGIPIIALTANALKGDSDTYLRAGMNDYLSKPFTEESLFNVIKRNLEEKTQPDEPAATPPASPAAVTENSGSPLYDLSMVRSVSGGDETFIKKMVQIFIETVPQGVRDLQEAFEKQEWQRLGKVAHKLKSTVDSMGITALKDDIRVIESNSKHETETASLGPFVKKVTDVINECIEQLKRDFPR